MEREIHMTICLPWWLRQWRICLQCVRPGFNPWVGKSPWKRKWQPLLYSCLGNSMDGGAWQANSPWGPKESDTTVWLPLHFTSLHHVWNREPVGICCVTQGAQTGALWQPRGVGWGGRGREVQERGDICTPMADSSCCMAETSTILENNYPSIKNK